MSSGNPRRLGDIARAAIQKARCESATLTINGSAVQTLGSAMYYYELGDFQKATELAARAYDIAHEANRLGAEGRIP